MNYIISIDREFNQFKKIIKGARSKEHAISYYLKSIPDDIAKNHVNKLKCEKIKDEVESCFL